MKTLNALTVRKKFGSVIDEVANKKVHIAISRTNKPLVVMIPIDDYERMESTKKSRKIRLQQVAERLSKWRILHKKELKNINSTSLIREMRRSG